MWRTVVDLLLTLVGSGRRVWRLQLVFFAIVLSTALTIASAGLSPPQVLRGVLLGGLILAFGTRTYGLETWEHLTLAAPMAAMFLALAAEPPIDL